MLPLAVLSAIAMLVTWFPLTTLWHQQHQLDSTTAQIATIRHQEQALLLQAKSISNKSNATLLARQQYQLVAAGQSLIQVLPGMVTGNPSQSSGDPGLQPLVSPSSVSTLVTSGSTARAPHLATAPGFLQRLVRTLEFWH